MAQQSKPVYRLGHGPTQVSAIAPAQAERLRTNGVYYMSDSLAAIGTFVASNVGYIDFPVGPYTYRQWGFSLTAPAAIPGVTFQIGSTHYVLTSKIADYIDTIIIEINGTGEWEMTAAELSRWNAYNNLDTSEGVLRIAFGSPNVHNTDMAEDAYQLGTANLRNLKLKIKTKAAWVTGMNPVVNVEYAAVRRNIGYFVGTTRGSMVNGAVGDFNNTDIAVGRDFAALWVQGASINRVKLTIDREIVFDQTSLSLRSMHEAWGKDVAALGSGFIYDAWRDGDSIGIDSVSDSVAERRRGADVRLDLSMGAASVAMTYITFHCGLFSEK